MKVLEIYPYLAKQLVSCSSTMLDLVISLTLVDLPRRLLSIQTRSKCSSPSLEKELQRREHQEKSVRAEQFPSLELLEIQTYHLQTKRKATFPLSGIARIKYHKDTLVLVPLCVLWWSRICCGSTTNRASTIQSFGRIRKQQNRNISWFWFTQKTIWCCRISYSQSRRETDALLVYWSGNRKHYCKRSQSRWTIQGIRRSRCSC